MASVEELGVAEATVTACIFFLTQSAMSTPIPGALFIRPLVCIGQRSIALRLRFIYCTVDSCWFDVTCLKELEWCQLGLGGSLGTGAPTHSDQLGQRRIGSGLVAWSGPMLTYPNGPFFLEIFFLFFLDDILIEIQTFHWGRRGQWSTTRNSYWVHYITTQLASLQCVTSTDLNRQSMLQFSIQTIWFIVCRIEYGVIPYSVTQSWRVILSASFWIFKMIHNKVGWHWRAYTHTHTHTHGC